MESNSGQDATNHAHGGTQLLFRSAGERYGIDILHVQEIISAQTLVRAPGCPPNVEGIIDLRGHTVAIMSLRKRLGLAPPGEGDDLCIIVLALVQDGESVSVGVQVDAVDGVQDIDPAAVEPPPCVGALAFDRLLEGVARVDDDVVLLLDLAEVLGRRELRLAAEPTDEG